mmetsp:Transcript_50519/g.109531  ORF Transcript_50519/g.109531 Transcript_50519/m.109531 type:complete len:660 (+) Transcript_50519:185-2164(+)
MVRNLVFVLTVQVATAFHAAPHTTKAVQFVHSNRLRSPQLNLPRRALPLLPLSLLAASQPAQADLVVTPWPYSTLIQEIDERQVTSVVISSDSRNVLSVDREGARHETAIFDASDLIERLRKADVRFEVADAAEASNGIADALVALLPTLLLIGGLVLLSRGGDAPTGGPGAFAKAKSDIAMEPETGVTFADVAGCDASKLELEEVVDFLKKPDKYSALGAKVPRGVLMEGPPGTGKTLLARAVAGEAGVPFISCSGSEFVEMFVGVGAARIRSLFSEAKKNAPCIVFIDEIDAVGRQRAGGNRGGMGGGNDEREQTLNQILTEMDGFEGNAGVIVIAATNRADVLDSALLRPGRFDRRVPVDLPDKDGRLAILKVHSRGKPIADDVQLDIVAKRTIGFSGASLANLMNEAAIVAARRDKKEITYDEIDYSIDRLTVGMQKTTGVTFPNRQRLVAYHEAGHAVMGALTPDYDMVTKVTIIPRTNGAGGFTLFTPTEERLESGLYSKRYLKGQLAVALGGRVAEEIIFGEEEVTTGASNDLQQVRNIARRMVAQWGYSKDKLGAVSWESPEGNGGFGPQAASPETEKMIDAEVKEIVADAYRVCKQTLLDNRDLLEELTEMLIDKETVDFKEMQELVGKYHPEIVDAQKLSLPAEAAVMG